MESDRLNSAQSTADWAARNGIDRARWLSVYESADIDRKIEQAINQTRAYAVEGTPSLVVDGRYLTSSGMSETVAGVIPILDDLIVMARERRAQKITTYVAFRPPCASSLRELPADWGARLLPAMQRKARFWVLPHVAPQSSKLSLLRQEPFAGFILSTCATARPFVVRPQISSRGMAVPTSSSPMPGVSIGTASDAPEDIRVFEQIIDVNVLGMAKTFQPFIDAMRSVRKGKLVGIASVAGYRGLPGAGAYSASKAAAISYLESLRVELHGSGVHGDHALPGVYRDRDDRPQPLSNAFSHERR